MPAPASDLMIYPLSPPTDGLVSGTSLFGMPETSCIGMLNWVPDKFGLRNKTGTYEVFQPVTTGDLDVCGTFGERISSSGVHDYFMFQDDEFRNASYGVETTLTGMVTITSNYWQFAQFKNYIFAVNGTDQPVHWIGSSNDLQATSWSGSGLTIADLINVTAYRNRLTFIEDDSLSVWQAADGAITGSLTEHDYSGFFKRGGKLLAIDSMTYNNSTFNETVYCMLSNVGELLVYQGDYHGSVDWKIIGRFDLSTPLGLRCMIPVKGDLHIMTRSGVVSVKALLLNEEEKITGNIDSLWRSLVSDYYEDDRYWSGVYNKDRDYVLYNLVLDDNGQARQLGYYLPTRRWFMFTGWNTIQIAYATNQQGLIFVPRDSQYVVYGDHPKFIGVDPAGFTSMSMQQAFTALGDGRKATTKDIHQIKMFFEQSTSDDYPPSSTPYTPTLTAEFKTDYKKDEVLDYGAQFSLNFDTATTYNDEPETIPAHGEVFSLKWAVTIAEPVYMTYNGANVHFTAGGVS